MNEATGQLYENETLHQCDTSSEEVLFGELSFSNSHYVPEQCNIRVGVLSNAFEESTSTNEKMLDEETGVLLAAIVVTEKFSRKDQADQLQ